MAAKLLVIPGAAETVVIAEERVSYLKVDRKCLAQQALRTVSVAQA